MSYEYSDSYDWEELIDTLNNQVSKIADLEAKLAESENKLNQYPYKNDVIEEQYEELKNGIKFRVENNITNDWEQLYHCIDVLCEKHKARIRDIENSICKIEQLEFLLKAKEKMKTQSLKGFEKLKQQLAEKDEQLNSAQVGEEFALKCCDEANKLLALQVAGQHQDKISFAVDKLVGVQKYISDNPVGSEQECFGREINEYIDNQIKQLKEGK